ncbi:MAG: flagellar basal body P-ring protein FlgI [Planctomycetota bacterium]
MRCLAARLVAPVALVALGLLGSACESNRADVRPPSVQPGETFSGPVELRGAVGSYASFGSTAPELVSGYGLVVGLNGTGSSEVPAFLRDWLINEMRRQGVGSARYLDTLRASPEQLLQSTDTAVVEVRGFRPAGAEDGRRFDLLVTAADTQTTSLEGGWLWTCDLAYEGLENPVRFSTPLAKAAGPLYLDPLRGIEDDTRGQDAQGAPSLGDRGAPRAKLHRQAVIVGGGRVTVPRNIEIVLNQGSWRVADLLRDRINERFPMEAGARVRTAEARNSLLIQLNVPERFQGDPERFVNLVQYLFTQRTRGFAEAKVDELIRQLEGPEPPVSPIEVQYALEAMGPTAVSALQAWYESGSLEMRLAALDAGARLGDTYAAEPLIALAQQKGPQVRIAAARALSRLPQSLVGRDALRQMLVDEDPAVRIAAYDALADQPGPLIDRYVMGDPATGRVKVILDMVRVDQPMLFIDARATPRIVVFDPAMGFEPGPVGRALDGRLMARLIEAETPVLAPNPEEASDAIAVEVADAARAAAGPDRLPVDYLDLFFQDPNRLDTQRLKLQPDVANLVFTLAHRPTQGNPRKGLDMSFPEVVDTLVGFHSSGVIAAPMQARLSPLVAQVREAQEADAPLRRASGAQDDFEGAVPDAGQPADDDDLPAGRYFDPFQGQAPPELTPAAPPAPREDPPARRSGW